MNKSYIVSYIVQVASNDLHCRETVRNHYFFSPTDSQGLFDEGNGEVQHGTTVQNSANSGQLVKHGETTGSFDIAPSPPLLLGVRSTILHLSSATNMVKNGDTRNPQDSRNNMKQHETT